VRAIPFIVFLCSLVVSGLIPLLSWGADSNHKQYVFFKDTQYPLRVHYLQGEKPGPTIMIQGGIQGDEDAGFITSQILTRTKVHTGNLLIVPRADVPSIHIHKRQFNVDLNRRFDRDYDQYFEDRLARVIRFLIGKCDGFIHLHEGSGFHTPNRIDDLHGPHRYGQSVIIDTDVYKNRLFLARMVETVLERVNAEITPKEYSFRLFNTRTFSTQTAYPEQQKSLSFYAVKKLNIPALAVEVSKNIRDLDWKVRHQMKVVGSFLQEFGLSCTLPVVDAQEIKNWYCLPIALRINGETVRQGPITLSANRKISISLDQGDSGSDMREYGAFIPNRPGYNMLGRTYLPLHPFKRIYLIMDGKKVADLPVRWQGKWPEVQKNDNPMWVYSLNEHIRYAPSGSAININEGDQLSIEGIWQGREHELLNVKGYVSSRRENTGQDIGIPLLASRGNFMTKYIKNTNNYWEFRVQRETKNTVKSALRFRVFPHTIKALELRNSGAVKTLVPAFTKHMSIQPGTYWLSDIWATGNQSAPLVMVDEWPVDQMPLVWKSGESHVISLYGSNDFKYLRSIDVHVSSPGLPNQPIACTDAVK